MILSQRIVNKKSLQDIQILTIERDDFIREVDKLKNENSTLRKEIKAMKDKVLIIQVYIFCEKKNTANQS